MLRRLLGGRCNGCSLTSMQLQVWMWPRSRARQLSLQPCSQPVLRPTAVQSLQHCPRYICRPGPGVQVHNVEALVSYKADDDLL